MMKTFTLIFSAFSACFASSSAEAEHVHTLRCRHFSGAPVGATTSSQRYAPDRLVDLEHLSLDVTPDFKNRRVAGTATLTFRPIVTPLEELRLDAVDLRIRKVTSGDKIAGWENTDEALIVTFEKPIPAGRQSKLKVTYEAEPVKGLYFRTPELGYDSKDTHLWTQGETIEARHWFPCFDAPNEFLTSTITCRVPKGMTVLSNGRKTSEKIDPETGLKAVTWKQEKPHVNYLISLVAGYFKRLQEKHGELSMSFWTPPSDFANAANSFRQTKKCMEYFEKEIGVPYPWAKYDQVCVQDFNWGGMENTSLSTLNTSTLFSKETENIRSSQGLVAHELAHQWFGDLVTCKDWSHIWLNEGFATYYTHLFAGHLQGRDQMLYGLYRDLNRLTALKDNTTAMVNRKYEHPSDMFRKYGSLSYTKGSWVLHMLRSSLGTDLFRQVVKTYLERHRHGNVVTDNLRAVIEELSGKSHDRFFDQYVYHAHHPELKVDYSWDAKTKLAKLSVKQEQKVDDKVMLFHLKLPVSFKVGKKTVLRSVEISKVSEDYYFALPTVPEIVRVDPDLTLLAKITFAPPASMLHAQLLDLEDVVGRLLAVEQLAKKKDAGTVEKLKIALNEDPFHGVRMAASKALREIATEPAFEALVKAKEQDDARVRRQVIGDVGSFYKPEALAFLKRVLSGEKNPSVRSAAINGLAGYDDAENGKLITQALASKSFRHQLGFAAVSAIRKQDDPAYLSSLQSALEKDEKKFTTNGFAFGLRTLGHLARNEEDKSSVRQFLFDRVGRLNRRVRIAAIDALGQLNDPGAIAVLEKFSVSRKDTPERTAAEKAIEALRSGGKPSDDLKTLRNEVTDLKKDNQKLHQDLEDLKKRLDAVIGTKTTSSDSVEGKK